MLYTKYISKVGEDYKISDHFTLGEFQSGDGADKVIYSTGLLKELEKIRKFFGGSIKITSGYRTKTYNAKVGGASNSAHLYGQAADFRVYDKDKNLVSPKDVCLFLEDTKWTHSIGKMVGSTHIDTKYANLMDETKKPYYFLSKNGLNFKEYFKIPTKAVQVSTLNVYDKPSGNVVRKLKKNQKVYIYSIVKDKDGRPWAKIRFAFPRYAKIQSIDGKKIYLK